MYFLIISRKLLCLRNLLYVLFAGGMLLPSTTLAWGLEGHRIVCSIAEQQLDEAGRRLLARVTANNALVDGKKTDQYRNFADACNWPDEARFQNYRGSYEQHFVNVPAAAERLDVARDCPATNCLLAGIQRHIVYLAAVPGGRREQARQVASLRFLGHYIGDLHQPLHVSHAEDLGGNRIKVRFRDKMVSLHRLWDVDALEAAGLTVANPPDAVVVPDGSVLDWAQASLSLARGVAYRQSGRPIVSDDILGETYQRQVEPVIRRQIYLAGVRLARLLNRIGAGDTPTVLVLRAP